jgi:hypothetical protein
MFLLKLQYSPVDEGPLGIHKVELVVEPGPGLGDGGRVGEHADAARHLCQVAAGDHGRRLVVDADLEAGGTPVHELDGPLGLDVGDGGIDVLGHHVAAVQHAARHVLPCEKELIKNLLMLVFLLIPTTFYTYKIIQKGAVAKSYMTHGLLICD